MSLHQMAAVAFLLVVAITALVLFIRDWRRAGRRARARAAREREVPLSRSRGLHEDDRGQGR